MLPHRRRFIQRFAAVVLPGPADQMPAFDAIGLVDAVERYVAEVHPFVRAGLLGLFDALDVLPLARGYRRPFARLSDQDAHAFLHDLERSRFYALRAAFIGAKAVVMLHYYGHASVEAKLGYSDDCLSP